MRISELSRQSGVPVATIKFYLRERLIPQGSRTGPNQAEYGEEHLRRLGLIRALTGMGRLDLSATRVLLAAIDDERLPLPSLYELVNQASFPDGGAFIDPAAVWRAQADVDGLVDSLGWQVDATAASRRQLVLTLVTLRRLGCDCGVEFFTPYAAVAEQLAAQECDLLPADEPADRAVAVVRTVLVDVALSALRRMAQAHQLALRFDRRHGAATE